MSELDYNALLKVALAHWIRKTKERATLSYLCEVMEIAGFREAAGRDPGCTWAQPAATKSAVSAR